MNRSDSLDPNVLQNDIVSHIISKVVMLAAQSNLHQSISEIAISVEDLARTLGYHPDAALKYFRLLDALNIIELNGSMIKLSPLTAALESVKSEHYYGSYAAFEHLETALVENRSCWEDAFGKSFYDHLHANPDKLVEFEKYLTLTANNWFPTVLDQYPFHAYSTIVDIGGGEGWLLAQLLSQNPKQHGILLEKEIVAAQAKATLKKQGCYSRVTIKSGDFFEPISDCVGDLYVLCRVCSNWPDEIAINILKNIKQAMPPKAKLLIIDFVIPDKTHPHYRRAVLHDLNLFVLFESAIRTEQAWVTLLKNAGFKNLNVTITEGTSSNTPNVPMILLEAE